MPTNSVPDRCGTQSKFTVVENTSTLKLIVNQSVQPGNKKKEIYMHVTKNPKRNRKAKYLVLLLCPDDQERHVSNEKRYTDECVPKQEAKKAEKRIKVRRLFRGRDCSLKLVDIWSVNCGTKTIDYDVSWSILEWFTWLYRRFTLQVICIREKVLALVVKIDIHFFYPNK